MTTFANILTAISKHTDINHDKYDILRDDELYPNTGATVHHFAKDGIDYIASLSQTEITTTFLTGTWKSEGVNGAFLNGDARAYAALLSKHAKCIKQKGYKLTIPYKVGKGSLGGRMYDGAHGSQVLPCSIRGYFVSTEYKDYDMKNAHPTLLLWLCNELKLPCHCLSEYVNDRAAVLLKADTTKKSILTVINMDSHKKNKNDWLNRFCKELVQNKAVIIDIIANDYNSTPKSKHPLSSKVNKLLCDLENRCLHAGMQAVEADEDTILMFDGFMTRKTLTEDEITDMNDSTELFGVQWVQKEWVQGVVPEDFEDSGSRTYEIMKAQWETTHFIVAEPNFSYWLETSEGAVPTQRASCVDASQQMYYTNSSGKKTALFPTWLEDGTHRSYTKVVYIPHAKHIPADVPEGTFNTAAPFAFDYIKKEDRDSNGIRMFNTLLGELSEDSAGLSYMLKYFAHLIQRPSERPEIMLLFKSHGGTGKDTLTKTFEAILGVSHCATVDDMEKLFGNFNGIIANKLFVTMNEVDGRQGTKFIEKLKNSLTASQIYIRFLHQNPYAQMNIARFLAFSNNSNPIPVESATARRALMNQVRADRQLDQSFFDEYYVGLDDKHWVDSIASDLCDYDLTDFKIKSPPETSSMNAKIQDKIQPLHKFMQDLVEGVHPDIVHTYVPKKKGCIAVEVCEFNQRYRQMLTELYPGGCDDFMKDKKYINNVFGNYNDIVYPKKRKSIDGVQKVVHIIHCVRLIAGLKNRCEFTMPDIDEDDTDGDTDDDDEYDECVDECVQECVEECVDTVD